jgi:hypothetical protein
MKTIALPDGRIGLIDDEDAALAAGYRWHSCGTRGQYVGAYVRRGARGTTLYLHRLIAGAGPGVMVDHRDGDPLNNARRNLRTVDCSENGQNRRAANGRSQTGVRNVYRAKGGRYLVQLQVRGAKLFCGYYGTIEDANAAAADARRRLMTHARESAT